VGEVVNLRVWRKRRLKGEEAQIAAQNREVFGQSKPERAKQAHKKEDDARHLDQHKLDVKPDDAS
jgi:Domain of unknown function (DUF4169)